MTQSKGLAIHEEALRFHTHPVPGKIGMVATKPMATQRDLSLAYSPGVAAPVRAISEDEDRAYDYTSKGNTVAVVTNGTAILGLGDLGPMASKPVMEGKSVLFKRFADIDSIDLELKTKDVERFVDTVAEFAESFGGINLEDIASPSCFYIERMLQERVSVPVFHDDQHGTAIIAAAGVLNACVVTHRRIEDLKVTIVGAGAAGLSVGGLLKKLGVKSDNLLMVDIDGVLYAGREAGRNEFNAPFFVKTEKRTLAEAMNGADCVLGLSAKGVISKSMIASMADNPIVFAMANPDPEITPEEIGEVRSDAIVATGRSDYPNQVNNVLGFPYIFRGALDVRAKAINEEMKLAAARAIAALAREDVPDEVAAAYGGNRPQFGPEYLIPAPFDPRLMTRIPPEVAKAAIKSGVARVVTLDEDLYQRKLAQRVDPKASFLQGVFEAARSDTKRVIFAEGEAQTVIRSAVQFKSDGCGHPVLLGRRKRILETAQLLNLDVSGVECCDMHESEDQSRCIDFLYDRLQRAGFLKRDVTRLVTQNRNVAAACMLALGEADSLVTGTTGSYDDVLHDIMLAIDPASAGTVMGMSVVLSGGRAVFLADTAVNSEPSPIALVKIAKQAARVVRSLGFTPRVAFCSYSTFGKPCGPGTDRIVEAVQLMDREEDVDFEYEGDLGPDVALDDAHHLVYPFTRLSRSANILVLPALQSASISSKLVASLGAGHVIGPVLVGLSRSVQIAPFAATSPEVSMMAALSSIGSRPAKIKKRKTKKVGAQTAPIKRRSA